MASVEEPAQSIRYPSWNGWGFTFINMKLGELLETYRKSKGLSVRALADEIGVDHTALFRLLNGQYSAFRIGMFMPLLNWLVGK